MKLVGELALWVALLMAAWGAIVSFAGGRAHRADLIESGERAIYASFACVVLAVAGVLVALLTSDFAFEYVATFTSANLPPPYRLAALWSGQAGSLLVWALMLTMCAAIAVATNHGRNREVMPYVAGTLSFIVLAFVTALCFGANPYQRLTVIPPEGQGMNPQLQHLGMVVHPPNLYLGYAATAVPFAFAVGALLVRALDEEWALTVRRWSVVSWLFLTVGLLTGMWWTYVELAPHARWQWDAVENSSFLPWLATSAFLYATSRQAQRSALRAWSVILATSGFLLAMFATFVTRTGIIATVHALTSSAVRQWFMGALLVALAAVTYFVATRLPELPPALSIAARRRPRYGRSVAYAGLFALLIGFAGAAFTREVHVSLASAEAARVADPFGRAWTFTSQSISEFDEVNRYVVAIALRTARGDQPRGIIGSERRQYVDSRGAPTFEPWTRPGIDYSLTQDAYVVLEDVTDERAVMRIGFNPLAVWVWIGGVIATIGGVLVMWPNGREVSP